jgi:hypothetical protein
LTVVFFVLSFEGAGFFTTFLTVSSSESDDDDDDDDDDDESSLEDADDGSFSGIFATEFTFFEFCISFGLTVFSLLIELLDEDDESESESDEDDSSLLSSFEDGSGPSEINLK